MTREPCAWCGGPIPERARRDSRFCSKSCRQASHRFGSACVARRRATSPLRLAYADPPYPGLAARYYSDHPDYSGEVDHRELVERMAATYDGWALSTSSDALPDLLAMIRRDLGLQVRVASWHRGSRGGRTRWPKKAWEPVVYAGGRREPSDESCDDAFTLRARPRTTDPRRVIGAKPAGFAFWLFDLMGARPGDHFVDLFPGSGGVARAWEVYESRATSGDASGARADAPRAWVVGDRVVHSGGARAVVVDVHAPGSTAATVTIARGPRGGDRQTMTPSMVEAYGWRLAADASGAAQRDASRLEPRRVVEDLRDRSPTS